MRDLRPGVHAGIGTAGALHEGLLAGQRRHRCGQCALDGEPVGLNLPTGERPAVIFDAQPVARHD